MHPDDQRATIVAIWNPSRKKWQYVEMFGCPFGLGSVVLTFNRFLALMVAMTRRVLFLLHGAYFDDNIIMDASPAAHHTQRLMRECFIVTGTPPKIE